MNKNIIIFIILMVLLQAHAAAQSQGNHDFSIGFYDKEIYYPDSTILIKAEIRNTSSESVVFKIADEKAFNFKFAVRTLTNTMVPTAEEFIRVQNEPNPVRYREISLSNGEFFSVILELNNYAEISEPGTYRIRGQFFPFLSMGNAMPVYSKNILTLHIQPRIPGKDYKDEIDQQTGEILEMMELSPDEIVTYTIEARQSGNWEKFFHYIDLAGLYINNGNRGDDFNSLSQTEREMRLESYKESLTNSPDTEISMLPVRYEILKTNYTPSEAYVITKQWFKNEDLIIEKEYTYRLKKTGNIWKIYDYSIKQTEIKREE